jgi:hypothetical protein
MLFREMERLLSITEMWYMKKIRYSKSRLRVQIGEDGAGIVVEQIDQTLLESIFKSKISPLEATMGDTAERRICWQRQKGFVCQ